MQRVSRSVAMKSKVIMKKTIWANTIVKNEERFLWFAVGSVIDHLDKMLIWDTGSTDRTVAIIKLLQKKYPEKIYFREYGEVDAEEFTVARNEMLDKTQSEWVLILDGDEIWWDDSIKKVINLIHHSNKELETIVTPYYNIIGDIYHYQENNAGMYVIDNLKGHYNIRVLNRNIPGLHLEKPHGQQGFYDNNGVLIQNREKGKRAFLDAKYMHFTNMVRSSYRKLDATVLKRDAKFKYELGHSFPEGFKYPEVFYKEYPDMVPNPWQKMTKSYFFRATIETLGKKIRRRFLPSKKVGY